MDLFLRNRVISNSTSFHLNVCYILKEVGRIKFLFKTQYLQILSQFLIRQYVIICVLFVQVVHASCANPFGYSSLQAFGNHPLSLSDSMYICKYGIDKLFAFTVFFGIFSATVLSGISSRSLYFLGSLILGDSTLPNHFTATNPSNFLSHVSNSDSVFIFFSRVGALKGVFSYLIFLSSCFSCAFSFIIYRLTLNQIFILNNVLNDILQSIIEGSYYKIYIEYIYGLITQLFPYLNGNVTIYFHSGLLHLHFHNSFTLYSCFIHA